MAVTALDGERSGDVAGVYRRAFIIGSGFFTVALIEPMYSAYVPLMLSDHLRSSSAVGGILSALNLIAPVVIPIFSTLSDRTRTAMGRRMPYIVGFLPPAAVALAILPFAGVVGLGALLAALVAMNFFRHAARGPVVSLMPDLVPPQERSRANGVINTMGGLAAITATVVLAPLISVGVDIPGVGQVRRVVPFGAVSVLMLAATLFLYITVKEPTSIERDEGEGTNTPDRRTGRSRTGRSREDAGGEHHGRGQRLGPLHAVSELVRLRRGGAVPILAGVLLWFLGWKSIVPFITMYARDVLGAQETAAGLSFGMLALSQTAAAIPAGIIADRLGRTRVMSVALAALVLVGIGILINDRLAAAAAGYSGLLAFWALLLCLGTAWAVLITNCLPLLWDVGGPAHLGLYTGLYYFASQAAPVLGPGLGGTIFDTLGFGALSLSFSVIMAGALILVRIAARTR
ncbi:MAG: MFS transporter [Spirochaetota bacterium]